MHHLNPPIGRAADRGRSAASTGPTSTRRIGWARAVLLASAASASLAVAGCGFVAKDGPEGFRVRTAADVTVQDTAEPVGYAVVKLSPPALEAANGSSAALNPAFRGLPRARNGRDIRIGVGDVLSVTVFEASAGGLFIPREAGSRAGNFVQIPSEQVDASGSINVPYAGAIVVAGKTARQAADEISAKLANRAIEPQTVVTIQDRRGSDVSVLGELNTPNRFFLDPGGLKILAAIGRAGGPKYPAYETVISVQRGGRTFNAPLTSIVKDPSLNIQLDSGDVVYVSREQKIFLALGATPSPGSIGGTNNRRFSFDADNMTLSEAAAKAGGLDTTRADPRAVFVYRMEPRSVLNRLGVDTSRYGGELVPTIYTADFSRGDAIFLANSFYMRDRDVIFVSEAPATDVAKFTSILSGVSGNASAFYGIR